MKKHIFVFIRYSVVLKTRKNNWIVGREEDFEGYKDRVFNPDRLKSRRELFEAVTLSSLDRQENMQNVTVVLLTSTQLPEPEKQALYSLSDMRDWLKVVELEESEKDYEHSIKNEVRALNDDLVYATVRLDDDDALSKDFFALMMPYVTEENVNRVISLGMGFAGIYSEESESFAQFKHYYYPKIAIGLAKIGKYEREHDSFSCGSIYADGRHTTVDQRSVTLVDARQPTFIRLMHANADTVGVHDKRIAKLEVAEVGEVARRFDFSMLDKTR